MFDAYPRQRISYSKVILPLSLVALLCLVLYAVFESTALAEGRQVPDDPTMKRMRPFLSSQTFEIGLWTRQKGSTGTLGPSSSSPTATSASRSSSQEVEVEELRQELERARVRTEEQETELARLRGSLNQGASKASEVGSVSSSVAMATSAPTAGPVRPKAEAQIPESLWREPPSSSTTLAPPPPAAPAAVAPTAATAAHATEEIPSKESSQEAVKDSTITVKTGDKEISIQIGKDMEATSSSTTLQTRGSDQMDTLGVSDVTVSTTQVASTRANDTDTKLSPDADGTLITVRSGQQSIVIQVRDGEVTTSSPSATTEPTNTTLAVENPLKALPELPELPPKPRATPKAEEPTLEGAAVEKGDKDGTEAESKTEEVTTTKGFSAYANLALRTR